MKDIHLTKKIFLVFLISIFSLTGAFALSGCQSSGPTDDVQIDNVPLDRRIGTVKSLGGVRTANQGTHILQLDDGDTVLLRSTSINLDDDKYSGATVEVRGVITYIAGSKSLMEVVNIDILENVSSNTSKTPEWKKYKDSNYGFQVSYRDDFLMEETSDGVVFEIPLENESDDESDEEDAPSTTDDLDENDSVEIKVHPKGEDETLVTYLGLDSDSTIDLLAEGYTKSKVGSYSADAYKRTDSASSSIEFNVEGELNIYTITFHGDNGNESRKNENLFFEMLATFVLPDSQDDGGAKDYDDIEAIDSRIVTDDSIYDLEVDTSDDDSDESGEDAEDEDTKEVAIVEGYSVFENESFDFNVQYPDDWYFGGSGSSDSDVIRHYEFGNEPIEESPGSITLDLMSSGPTGGQSVSAGGKTLTKVKSGNNVEFYFEGSNGRFYKVTGSSSQEDVLLQMASSITE